ncbi:hypothetical protein P7K49_028533 [Saguinus oedipus]|uniref:Uncharacterized protein n=1 Tax=Saguinus oedipus TaxID=9490 RepID=A0ABQ9U5H8_SAGOE|nr:hypothetical protein P7K49_028533 [Saguinus oedipus]
MATWPALTHDQAESGELLPREVSQLELRMPSCSPMVRPVGCWQPPHPASGEKCPPDDTGSEAGRLGWATLEPGRLCLPLHQSWELQPSHKAQQKSRVLNCKSSPTWDKLTNNTQDAKLPEDASYCQLCEGETRGGLTPGGQLQGTVDPCRPHSSSSEAVGLGN